MFDLTFEMGWIGAGTLAFGSVVVGLAVFFVGAWASRFEWLLDVIAAFAGGFIASEYLGDLGTWGPNVDGLFVSSALIGGVIAAVGAAVVTRFVLAATEERAPHA